MAFREIILHNFWLKMFSLVLATLVWFAVHILRQGDFTPTRSFITQPTLTTFENLPISIMKDPADPKTYRMKQRYVSVTLTGEAAVLRELERSEIKVYVDLNRAGQRLEPSEKIRLHTPANVTVVAVRPLAVQVEEIETETK